MKFTIHNKCAVLDVPPPAHRKFGYGALSPKYMRKYGPYVYPESMDAWRLRKQVLKDIRLRGWVTIGV